VVAVVIVHDQPLVLAQIGHLLAGASDFDRFDRRFAAPILRRRNKVWGRTMDQLLA
jgi:hypothetical protein